MNLKLKEAMVSINENKDEIAADEQGECNGLKLFLYIVDMTPISLLTMHFFSNGANCISGRQKTSCNGAKCFKKFKT